MTVEGGCYCGALRYAAEGEPRLRGECYCRPCQHFTGGGANLFMLMPPDGFRWTRGEPKRFTRSDRENAVTREFCGDCGTQLTTRRPGLPLLVLKVGTLDDPSLFGGAAMAIFTAEKQPFHQLSPHMPAFEGLPER
jgi:hypothetical protein